MDVRLAGAPENSRDFGRCNLALRIPSRYSPPAMHIPALPHPGLILSVQVRSQAKAPVQAEESASEPANGEHRATLREAALLRVALRETGRLADQLDALSLL